MIKRMAAVLLACPLLSAAACAEDDFIGAMRVVNCKEWVSLREKPDASSECLVEVPLGAVVANCANASKAFIYAEYGGLSGYIMSQYLEVVPVELIHLGDMRVAAEGMWTPMYLGAAETEPVIQWMAPGVIVEDCTESADGFAYGMSSGMKGYIRLDALKAADEVLSEGN